MHSPEHAKEIQEARKLGGLRRKREVTVAGAYDFEGLGTVEGIRRLIEVAVLDTLGMENSLARARTLAYLAQVALRTLEVGDLEQRIGVLEQAVNGRRVEPANASVFEVDPAMLETGGDETKESSSENIGKEKTDATE
jgi:hypothetical protein